jgi:catechol 2,3-dioxygenase-like lactoylglutathione lyase family enzyme
MISGAHVIAYSKDAEADRAFLRDILGLKFVDAGHGWLIFALPPAEIAVHPADEIETQVIYFMCDDLKVEVDSLAKRGVSLLQRFTRHDGDPLQRSRFPVEVMSVSISRNTLRP